MTWEELKRCLENQGVEGFDQLAVELVGDWENEGFVSVDDVQVFKFENRIILKPSKDLSVCED